MTTQRQLMRANSDALGCGDLSVVPFLWILLSGVLIWMTATAKAEAAPSAMTLEDKVYAQIRDQQEQRRERADTLERRYRTGDYR